MGKHHHLRHEEVRGGSDHRSPAWTGCVTGAMASGKGTPTVPSDPARRELADRPLPNHSPLLLSDLQLAPPISQPQAERGQEHPLILCNHVSFLGHKAVWGRVEGRRGKQKTRTLNVSQCWGAWLAQWVAYVTLDLRVESSSPVLGVVPSKCFSMFLSLLITSTSYWL